MDLSRNIYTYLCMCISKLTSISLRIFHAKDLWQRSFAWVIYTYVYIHVSDVHIYVYIDIHTHIHRYFAQTHTYIYCKKFVVHIRCWCCWFFLGCYAKRWMLRLDTHVHKYKHIAKKSLHTSGAGTASFSCDVTPEIYQCVPRYTHTYTAKENLHTTGAGTAGFSLNLRAYIYERAHGWEVGGWGRVPFSRNLMKPTPRRKWYLTTGRRFH